MGKSTLFNRLTRSRNALVADMPGVTRDRQYGIAEYEGRPFYLIDTGGLGDIDEANQAISQLVSEHSLGAVKEADAVLWLVDGRTGLTAADEILAPQLRPLNPHIYLAVNKTEGMDQATVCAEFHRLGFGEPYPISAARGDGIATLLATLLATFEVEAPPPEPPAGLRIGVIGRPNVGKSTLINRMLGEERLLTYDQPGTTRDSIAIPFTRREQHYVLIDTAGVRRRARITEALEKFSVVKTLKAIDDAQIIILVMDAQEAITEQDLGLLGITTASGKSLIIAINKWDGLDNDQRTLIKNQIDRKLAFADYATTHFISALHGSGVGKLFDSIDKIGASQGREFKSALITEILQEAVAAHPPPLVHGRRIKLRYAHIGGHNPLRIIIHGNQTAHVPAAYRRYLSNYLRKHMQLVATPVLIEFKQSKNPFQGKPNVLTKRQIAKRKRLLKHVKRK